MPGPETGVIGGFRIERWLAAEDRAWRGAEATGEDGRPARLWVGDTANDDDRLARLERLRAVRDLPLVAPAATGRDGERAFAAWVLPAGTTLDARLADGPLPQTEALRLLSEVAGGLGTLATAGLPHAHLAPERVLLTTARPPHALLYDYGFQPAAGEAAARDDLLAIADYLAPEVAAGGPRTTAADVYALACVLVECLTGAPPFAYDRPALVLAAHREQAPPEIAAATGLPPELDRVLRTALHKRPEHRQQTPAGLLRAAQRALGRERFPIPVVTLPPLKSPNKTSPRATAATPPPAGASPRAARASRRHRSRRVRRPVPSGAAVGITTLVVLAATAGFATATSRPRATPEASSPAPAAAVFAHPDAVARAAVVAAVDRVTDHLAPARVAARHDLRTAAHPRAQAAAAARLATIARDARHSLPPPAALAAAAPARELPATLRAVERGYRDLAAAARQGNAHAYDRAARAVQTGELRLDRALRALSARA
jgi:serine/threonine-protein kinase